MYKVYKITNSVNDKVYIGITKQTLKQRLKNHKCDSRRYKTTAALHNAIIAHPDANWEIHLLEDNIPDEQIDDKERYYIALYDSYNSGYNCTIGGRRLKGANHPSTHKKLYVFVNKHTGLEETLTASDFYNKYSYEPSLINKFVAGKIFEIADWYIKSRGMKPKPQPKYMTKFVPKVYTLYHDIFGKFEGTLEEFKKKYPNMLGTTKKSFNANFFNLTNNRAFSIKGWRITSEKHQRRDYCGVNNPNYRHGKKC